MIQRIIITEYMYGTGRIGRTLAHVYVCYPETLFKFMSYYIFLHITFKKYKV